MSATILLVDDDASLRRVTRYHLEKAGFRVRTAASGREGLGDFQRYGADLVITDVKLGDMSGLEVLAAVKEQDPETPVVVITAFGTIEMAVEAMQRGAFNFITKPFDRETLRHTCVKALELRRLRDTTRVLHQEVDRITATEGMESANSAMRELLATALKVAGSEATVLITGESGTGKEVLARLIHRNSRRRSAPMVCVNCSAIPDTLIESELFGHVKGAFTGAVSSRRGRFQSANGGTLFLDEIGELRPELQAKLLRVVQEGEVEPVGAERPERVDVRIVAATNRNLQEEIAAGRFREDLYYRLSVIPLHLPPLRERKEDIPALVEHFLRRLGAPAGVRFSPRVLAAMQAYDWPGNIRELQNAVERCLILRRGEVIDDWAPPAGGPGSTAPAAGLVPDIPDEGISLEEVEKELIRKALAKSGGNRSEAARLLRIPRHVLTYRLEKFGIRPVAGR